MKNSIGSNLILTVFGESHGVSVGAVLDGLPAGIEVDNEFIKSQLSLRSPIGEISTARREEDNFIIHSGVFNGKTTGTPICITIPNQNTISKDYSKTRFDLRPGHADYTASVKYNGFEDYRGGGHFSGRVTAGIVAAGAIAIKQLSKKGVLIGTHISRCGGINDTKFNNFDEEIQMLNKKQFAVIDDEAREKMIQKIISAKEAGDSVGGILETAIIGLPAGVGEPWFDTLEGTLSKAIFSIPAIKGVEFGAGFQIADMLGSEANDMFYCENGAIKTKTNNNAGINGGISNGMPVIMHCAVKPTPTISKEQNTVNTQNNENVLVAFKGRHDPCIVHRARVVIDSIVAIVLCDMLSARFGTEWLGNC